MNFKRGRPKNRRAGCLLCKPHKANGCKSKAHARDQRKLQDSIRDLVFEALSRTS